jgi:hypothetical protein
MTYLHPRAYADEHVILRSAMLFAAIPSKRYVNISYSSTEP